MSSAWNIKKRIKKTNKQKKKAKVQKSLRYIVNMQTAARVERGERSAAGMLHRLLIPTTSEKPFRKMNTHTHSRKLLQVDDNALSLLFLPIAPLLHSSF